MAKLFTAFAAIALVLLGIVFTVSYKDASANGASYLAAIGITGVPLFLRTALAGTVFTVVLTGILTAIVTSRVIAYQSMKDLSDLSFAHRSDALVDEMREYLKYDGYGTSISDPNKILQDCNSFNLTLRKAGFDIPFVPSGTAVSMFDIFSRYYVMIGPLLRDNHPNEARQMARSFSDKYPWPTDV